MTLIPAYGRDYKTAGDVIVDFEHNKDFKTPEGPYTNKADLLKLGVKFVNIRFKKLTRVIEVEVKP